MAVQRLEPVVASGLFGQKIGLAVVRLGTNGVAVRAVDGDALEVRNRSIEVRIHQILGESQFCGIVRKYRADVAEHVLKFDVGR